MSITKTSTNVNELKINYLTQSMYDDALANNQINDNELYMTPFSYDSFVDFFYPVGSYYETSDTTFDPNISWGGTWSLLGEGQVLLSGSASGTYAVGTQYGGNTKTITANNLPTHTHTMSHTHTLNNHTHTMSHTHTLNNHTHTMSHTHPMGTTNYARVMTTSATVVSDDAGAALSGSGYKFPRVDTSYGFGVAANTQGSSAANTGSSNVNTGASSAANTGSSNVNTGASSAANTGDNTTTETALDVMQLSTAVHIWHRTA